MLAPSAIPYNLQRAKLRREEEERASAATAARARARVAAATAELRGSQHAQSYAHCKQSSQPAQREGTSHEPALHSPPSDATTLAGTASVRTAFQKRVKGAWTSHVDAHTDGLPRSLFCTSAVDAAGVSPASEYAMSVPDRRVAATGLLSTIVPAPLKSRHSLASVSRADVNRAAAAAGAALAHAAAVTYDSEAAPMLHQRHGVTLFAAGGHHRSALPVTEPANARPPRALPHGHPTACRAGPVAPLQSPDADAMEEAEAEAEAVRTAAALTAARRQLEAALREARSRASGEASAREAAVAQLGEAVARAEAAETAVRASTHARAAADVQLAQSSLALRLVEQQLRLTQDEKDALQMALHAACTERSRAVARAELAEGGCVVALAARDEAAQQLAAAEARAQALHAECESALLSATRPLTADATTDPIRELVLAEQSAGAKLEVLMHEVRVLRLQRDQQDQMHARLERRGAQRGSPTARCLASGDPLADTGAMPCHSDDEEEERPGSLQHQESAEATRRSAVTRAMVCWYRAAEARRTTRLRAATVVQARERGCSARRATGARAGAF